MKKNKFFWILFALWLSSALVVGTWLFLKETKTKEELKELFEEID